MLNSGGWARVRTRGQILFGAGVFAAISLLLAACGGGDGIAGADAQEAGGVKTAQAVGRMPTIAWTPNAISATALAGTTQTIQVKFTPSVSVANVIVTASKSLAGLVSISPSSFASLAGGQTATATLTFAPAPDAAPAAVSGLVQVSIGATTLSQTLPIAVNVVWPVSTAGPGISINYPPNWIVKATNDSITASNVSDQGEVSIASLRDNSFLRVLVRRNANPRGLPVAQWFDQFLRPTISTVLLKEQDTLVAGRGAYYTELGQVGGRTAHYYVANGTSVVEISYGLYAATFVPRYEAMLKSLSFSQ